MVITKVKDIGYSSDRIYNSEDTFYQAKFPVPVDGLQISFSAFDIKLLFGGLANFCTHEVFEQIVKEGNFNFYPNYNGHDFDAHLGKGEVIMGYAIKDGYIIAVSPTEQQPGLYWLIIEGVWKIEKSLDQ